MSSISLFIFLTLYYIIAAISTHQTLEENKIFMVVGKEAFLVNIIENPITKKLISLLPLKTNLLEEKKSTKQLILPTEIETENDFSPKMEKIFGQPGDIFLRNGKELVLFNETATINNENGEYVKLGVIEEEKNLMKIMQKSKQKILLWNTLDYEYHKGKINPYTYYSNIMNFLTWKVLTFFCFLLL